ncbi:MAG: ubiquinone/menaquinone biosynthesis methyltransferase [Proteobacteria bacterium]|nr:ubiquinone/menaquinone biosynthesis methyltransferase [Pseudomonadota bacterium]
MSAKSTRFIQTVFSEVPATYELVNHILTFGLDRVWRKRAARIASTAAPGEWADMCTGTGETAVYLRRLAPKETRIWAVDISPAMMAEATRKQEAESIDFVTADIKKLPFGDGSLDLITLSFATRNLNLSREILAQSFSEFHRVLKSGGRLVNLETSQPRFALVRKIFHLYVKLCVKRIGSRISGSETGYAYLAATITRFCPAEILADIIRRAGFEEVVFQKLLFGVAAIHQAMKRGNKA